MYQNFIKDHNLSPLPHHSPIDTNLPEPRPWTFSRSTGKDSVGSTIYSFSRIDDSLLPTTLANTCKPSYTCDLGYLSDHVPLLAIVPTCTLNLRIPHIVKAQAKKAAKQATLTCPVSASDQLKFTHALSDPSHGIIQELEETLLVLTPAHTQALAFLNELQNKSARNTARLQHLSEKPAEEQIEILAISVTNLTESVHKVALKTCSSTSKSTTDDQQQIEEFTQTVRSIPPNHHYSLRPEKNKRNIRSKILHRIKQIQNHLSSPFINAQGTTEEILQQNSANTALMKAIHDIKHIVPNQPLKKQLDDIYTRTRQAITNTAALHLLSPIQLPYTTKKATILLVKSSSS